jgi:hypothetical protein
MHCRKFLIHLCLCVCVCFFSLDFQTAFFEVSEDAPHGSELVCSYPSCRNSGVRFLYCKFCDAAISRRGFKSKHVHDDLRRASMKGTAVFSSGSAKKRVRDDDDDEEEEPDDSSQDLSSDIESDEKGLTCGSEKKHFKKKRDSLRMEELKRHWTRLLEECRDHCNTPNAKSKRAEWLQMVESIYDEFSSLGKLDC